MHEINDVALRRVGVVVLELERFVHAIFSERRELDKETQRANQVSANDQILLSSDLRNRSALSSRQLRATSLLTPSSAFSKSFRAFSRM